MTILTLSQRVTQYSVIRYFLLLKISLCIQYRGNNLQNSLRNLEENVFSFLVVPPSPVSISFYWRCGIITGGISWLDGYCHHHPSPYPFIRDVGLGPKFYTPEFNITVHTKLSDIINWGVFLHLRLIFFIRKYPNQKVRCEVVLSNTNK